MQLQNIRQALRALFQRPWFTFAAVTTLGLGIGANSAVFSVINGVLLQPLDYPGSDRLVVLRHTSRTFRDSENPRFKAIWDQLPLSYLNYLDIRQQNRVFAAIGIHRPWRGIFNGGSEPLDIRGAEVSPGLLEVLGVQPLMGRFFREEEIRRRDDLALLSFGFWQRHFGANADILGRSLRIGEKSYEVVGVMPGGFRIAPENDHQLWVPLHPSSTDMERRGRKNCQAMARLRPDVSLAQAREAMDQIAINLESAHPEANEGVGLALTRLDEVVIGDSRPMLYLLGSVVCVVLLIACANAAGLLVTEYFGRRREIAIRLSLGASRGRIVRQLMTESLVLAAAAAAAGLLLAHLGQRVLVAFLPAEIPRTANIAIDVRVLAFTLLLGLLTTFVFGLGPALRICNAESAADLRSGSVSERTGRAHQWVVGAEIALTMLLLTQAGLLINSFLRLTSVDPGFRAQGLVTQKVNLISSRYREKEQLKAFYSELLARLKSLPGVEKAGASSLLPFAGGGYRVGVEVPGVEGSERAALLEVVAGDYFQALEIPLERGRFFEESDHQDSPSVVIINELLAKSLWPDSDPVGQTLLVNGKLQHTVAGVVGNVKAQGLDEASQVKIYRPFRQAPSEFMILAVRSSQDSLGLVGAIRQTIHLIDGRLPLPQASTMEGLIWESVASPRSRTVLLGAFAAVAILLAVVGLYGVLAYSVTQRIRDIGIRMALGAGTSQMRSLVFRQTIKLIMPGLGLGALGALLASRLLSRVLFGIEPTDPATYLLVGLALTIVALAAGCLPAERAARVDPIRVLRTE